MNRPLRPSPFLLGVLALTSCAVGHASNVWRDPSYQPAPVRRVFVVAVAPERQDQLGLENALAEALLARGFEVATAAGLWTEGPVDQGKVKAYAKEMNVDLVVVEQPTFLSLGEAGVTPAVAKVDARAYGAGRYPDAPVWSGTLSARNFVSVKGAGAVVAASLVESLIEAKVLVR